MDLVQTEKDVNLTKKHICRGFGYGLTENREFSPPTDTDRTRPHWARLGVLSVKALRGASVGAR